MLKFNRLFLILAMVLGAWLTIYAQAPITPLDTETGVSQATIVISWTDFDDGNGNGPYDVEFGTDPGFGIVDVPANNTVATSLGLPPLLFNTSYYWRIRDTDTDGLGADGPWHSFSFTTEIGTPVLTSPADGATGQALSLNLSWTIPDNDAGVTYNLYHSTNGGGTWTIENGVTSPYLLGGLSNNVTYTWRIEAEKAGETSKFSSNRTFTTLLATPQQLTPANSSSFLYVDPVSFIWNMAGNYSNVDFTVTIAEDVAYTAGVQTTTVSGVLTGNMAITEAGLYYWKVDAEVTSGDNIGETTTTAGSFTFTMTIPGPPLDSPINGLTGVSILPTLTWESVPGAVSYKLYVDDAPDFLTPLYEVNEGTDTTRTFDALIPNFPLDNNTLYYWRVSALDLLANEYFSATYHFTTILPINLTLSWPVDSTLIYVSPVTFGWYTQTSVADLKFTVQYKYSDTPPADESFWTGTAAYDSDPFTSVTVTAATSTQQPVSLTAKEYYWRVIVQSDNDDAYIYYPDYDEYVYFETVGSTLATVIPSYPTNGTIIYTYTPTIYWYTYEYSPGLLYQVKYGTSGDDVAPADGELDAGTKYPLDADMLVDGITDLYYTLPTLLAGTEYFWQVRGYHPASDIDADPANGPEGWTEWSDIADFEITGGTNNSIAIASWPIGNPIVYDNSLTLYWFLQGSSLGITGYEVKYRETGPPADWTTFNPGVNDATGGHYTVAGAGTYSVAIVPDLNYGSQYYWAVYPTGAASVDPLGEGSFNLIETECNPVQIYPEDDLSIFGDEVTLSWYSPCGISTIISYSVEYSQSDVMAGSITIPGIDPSTPQTTLTGLNDGASYYWRVTAHYPLGVTTQSPIFSFTTYTGFAPVIAPIAVNPNNVLVSSSSTELLWALPQPAQNSQSYEIQIADNPYFIDKKVYEPADNTLQIENLQNRKAYFWRVKAKSDNGKGSKYSDMGQFVVGSSVTDVETDIPVIPSAFVVEQNYPNPFNPVTTISFSIPQNEYVTVRIYDMLGREVKTLLSSEINTGRHSIQWNGDNNSGAKVSSGTYIYRVTAGGQHQSFKMLLMK